jgi:hypothetical protein
MMRRKTAVGMAAAAAAATAAAVLPTAGAALAAGPASRHVLLLSVDGLHQSDLTWYVAHRPGSVLARLVQRGSEYTQATTPFPSDSFPGMVGQVTGGDPRTTGIYYDDSWNRRLLPAGTTTCSGATPGAEVTYFEQADKNSTALDAGQGLAGLPASIASMTGQPRDVIDPKQLPVDPSTCKPVYPHEYLRVNTVFEVAHAHGLRTAWSDKHAAYDVLQGPSGSGIDDLFTPEINSAASVPDADWTASNTATQIYDGFKVDAVLREIDGFDHSGSRHKGVPAVFGMNFQTVSTAQKLPISQGQAGGYTADGTPGTVLARALDSVDYQIGRMTAELQRRHLFGKTTIILSAKHGQSPTTPGALTRIPDGPIIDGLNAAWKQDHPQAPQPLVAFSISDDGMLLWLTDRSTTGTDYAKNYLLNHNGTGNDVNGADKAYTASGLSTVYAGQAAADLMGVPPSDDRVPDLIGIAQHGVVYTGKKTKIAEHGGADEQDRHVPLVISGPGATSGKTISAAVETTRIAPTILHLLGLSPRELQAVARQGTRSLL